MTAVIQADDLRRDFDDTPVVQGVDLQVDEGRIHGFVGPSGSGKTTTVRMLAGVLAPTSGRASLLGQDPRNLGVADRQRVGYMPQMGVLYPELSIKQNLLFVASVYGVRKARARISAVLEQLDLGGQESLHLMDASGGMQRRVALAAALLHKPEVLFLDEPTSGLDPVLRQEVWEEFARLRDEGRTIFVTTQIVSEATRCDTVGLIADGRMLADGTPDQLRRTADGGDVVALHTESVMGVAEVDHLRAHRTVTDVRRLPDDPRVVRVVVTDADRATEELEAHLATTDVRIRMLERSTTPFDDVFVALLERGPAQPTSKTESEATA